MLDDINEYDFPGGSVVNNPLLVQETWVQSLGQEDLLQKGMATSSIVAWGIPWTEEPGGLQFVGLQSWSRLSDRAQEHDKWIYQGSI